MNYSSRNTSFGPLTPVSASVSISLSFYSTTEKHNKSLNIKLDWYICLHMDRQKHRVLK